MGEEILYIVSDYGQWCDPVDLKKIPKKRTQNIVEYIGGLKYFPYFSFNSFISNQPTWTFCIGGNGQVLSIVQQTTLEMRTEKHYNKTLSKATLPDLISDDLYPSKRLLVWSPDCSIFAIATTHGHIACYDLLASNLFIIESIHKSTKQPDNNIYAKEMVFLDLRTKSSKWSYELILIGGNGSLTSYAVSSVYGYQIQHTFNFIQILGASTLSSVTSCPDPAYIITSSDVQNKLDINNSGLNLWSMISYEPYYNPVLSSNIVQDGFLLKILNNTILRKQNKYIIKMSISPSYTMLACLYGNRTVCVWNFPEITVCKNWSIKDQKELGGIIDIEWWCNDLLIMGCFDGTLIICREKGQQSVVNIKINPFCFKLCGSYNSDNFVVADFETVESFNNSQDAIVNAKPTTTNMYKLIAVTKTTPQQLLMKKIQEKQYEDALQLALKYNLNKDLVYKHQWCNSTVLEQTINNILSKVSDKQWIVHECCNRVPETLIGAKQLIAYGLEITDFSAYLNIESENTSTFSQTGKEFIISRLKLLNYLDKLTTYEIILKKMSGTCESLYSAQTYEHLRDLSPKQWALQLARECQVNAVFTLITYYSDQILPYWLDILNDLPETLMPKLYRHLLPVWDISAKQVVLLESKILRELDWCESDRFKLLTGTFENIKIVSLTENDIILWYIKRIRSIESCTKLVQHTLELATIARENNIKGLEQLHEDLSVLEVLVYEVGLENIFLEDIEQLNTIEKASLFMSRCDENTFLNNFTNYFLPYIQTKSDPFYLLEQYLIQISVNSLKNVSQFFEFSQKNGWCINVSDEAKIVLGLKCIYTNTKSDQLDEAQCIVLSLLKSVKYNAENKTTIKQLEEIKPIINASKLLLAYGIRYPLKVLIDNLTDNVFFRNVMISICEYTSIKNQTEKYWSNVLGDLLKITELCFPTLSITICYEEYVKKLLASQNEKIMLFSKDILLGKLPENLSLRIVKDKFSMYFDQSKSFNDSSMALAKLCLQILPNTEDLLALEWNLISAMTILNTFGTKLLPVQVRQSKNKWKLIDMSILAKPNNYTLLKKLTTLANKLGITSHEGFISIESNIFFKCATIAYQANDLKFSSKMCIQLMDKNEPSVWSLCVELALHNDIIDIGLRINLLSFAVFNCPVDKIVSIIELRKSLENENTEQIFECDSELELPKIININYLPVSNYEISMHSNCANCVEVALSHEDLLSNFRELLKVSYNHSNYDKVLAIYGYKYLGYDSKMSVLCFLHITNDSIVDECFNGCEGILSTKLALYIYALRYATQFMCDIDYFKLSTDQLIKQVMSDLDTKSSETCPEIEQYLRKYALLYSKCAKGLDSNVSPEEMNKELMRMAGTGQTKHLEKALEICKRQSLDINDKLLLVFLKHCLYTTPARNLEEILITMDFNSLIKDDKQLYYNIMHEVYEDIPGTNHNVLIAYYTVLNFIYSNDRVQYEDNMTPTQHIKLLKRVHSTIPDIDYKCLLNLETAYETFCIAQQTGCSTPVLNRLLKSLPEKIQHCIKLPRSTSMGSDNYQDNVDFNKLLLTTKSPADIDRIVRLSLQANDNNKEWVEALKKLLVFEPLEFRISISVLKYICSKYSFSKQELEDLNDIPNVNKILLNLLYLLSGESTVEAAAINYFHTNNDLPDSVLDTILEYGLVEQLIESEQIMNNLMCRALAGNSGKNCRLVCEQLASAGHKLLAGSLYLTHNGVPSALKTNIAAYEISESYLGRNTKEK
ncbi:WD40/YVTN repeat-like-containing domain,WD40-repeat-containing domain,Neuroblastoma-amplified sequence [Cinara cedri]|uniref:WD40/YVTN repeat-like-containing domain,WD40-repeat-containing domain,Neuroblastoma-amplified sequence n=1 Tax=Cinara cedri TaxID=506608 RepID=A0A5E4M0U0_9HEMI|nr:WD40/YVTN repeat-like-containing domain,WD40-repeat-containing domain,Neuroblastoma-amplified sequence [Cinara cedri]